VGDTTVVAPFDGYVSERPVAAGQNVSKSTRLVRVLKINPIKLLLAVPEASAGQARNGMEVIVTVQAHPGKEFPGRIVAINPAVDPATRSMMVEAHIPNAERLLLPGMFASGRILQGVVSQVLFIPRGAISSDANTDSLQVYVVKDGRAHLRVVQLGKQQEKNLASIASGLQCDELVATGDVSKLYDGAAVRIR
jgi:membrane fusion protein (multidrug efflux system)